MAEEDVGAGGGGYQHDQGTESRAVEEEVVAGAVVVSGLVVVFVAVAVAVVVVRNKTGEESEAGEHGTAVLEIILEIKLL